MNVFTKRELIDGHHVVATTTLLENEADIRDHADQFFAALDVVADQIEEGDDIVSVSITVVRRESLN